MFYGTIVRSSLITATNIRMKGTEIEGEKAKRTMSYSNNLNSICVIKCIKTLEIIVVSLCMKL